MRLLKKSMAILMTAVMVTTMTPITAEAASKKYVKSLTLSKKSITIEAGKTGTITAKVKVKGSLSKKVKISLSKANKKVVKKVKIGKPNSKGVSKITFTAADVEKEASTKISVVTAKKNKKGKKITKKVTVKVTPKKTTEASTTETTEAPTTEAPVYLSYEGYELDWADEFTGTELNRDNWNVELHDPGWVNAELQAYVDSKENIYVKDGKLVLNPVQTKNADGTYSYTSGRVNTQNKKTYTYGMFEVKAKVPEGKGYLPAFWLMANDENVYGQWPRCGEIDIMEVHGSDTSKAYGTIHYGNPHKEQQGTYTLKDGSYSDEYHTYTCEWEPGKITWYVDGVKFHEASDWYSATEGGSTISYPAPFDQPFYIILNLAVGGSWVGYPDDATFKAQPYMIDYVRVYQKEGGYDDSNVTAPEKEAVVIRDADANGNYLINGDFSVAEDLTEAKDWQFKTANDGVGATDLSAGNATVTTTNAGTVDYSIQLVQNDVPLIAGQTYVLSYDAYASADRKMIVASKAPNNSWYAYLSETVSLTTTKQTFTHEFTMTHTDDANCTVEFNMGNFGSTATVVIDNVSLKLKDGKIDEAARDAINNPPKSVRADGNYIYNGEFQEGNKKLGYWTIPAGVDASVTPLADGRRLKVVVPKDGKVTISQPGVPVVANAKYALSFDAEVPVGGKVDVAFLGKTYSVDKTTKGYGAKLETAATIGNTDIAITFDGAGIYYIDNVRVEEDSIVKNGSFNAGISTAWDNGYKYTASYASFGVDSITYDNAASVTITDTDDAEWKIQLKQENMLLEEGKCYELSFKAWSDLERDIICAIQRNGNNAETKDDWTNYLATQTVSLTKDKNAAYSYKFKMKQKDDADCVLAFSMGTLNGERIKDKHVVYIDDVMIKEIDESEMPKEPEIVVGENMLENADFATGELAPWKLSVYGTGAGSAAVANNAVEVNVTNPGTADGMVALKYENLTLEQGAQYKLSFKATAEQTRQIKPCFMDPIANYAWYGGQEYTCNAGEETVIEMNLNVTGATSDSILFQVGLGVMPTETPACKVTMWDFQLVKVGGDDTTAGEDDTTTGGDDTTAGEDDTTTGGSDDTTDEGTSEEKVEKGPIKFEGVDVTVDADSSNAALSIGTATIADGDVLKIANVSSDSVWNNRIKFSDLTGPGVDATQVKFDVIIKAEDYETATLSFKPVIQAASSGWWYSDDTEEKTFTSADFEALGDDYYVCQVSLLIGNGLVASDEVYHLQLLAAGTCQEFYVANVTAE